MKKRLFKIFGFALFGFALSCSAPVEEGLEGQIALKKKELETLKKELSDLESKLPEKPKSSDPVLVNVQKIEPVNFKHFFTVFGEVEAVNYAKISPEIGGRIEKIHVSQGDYVTKGKLLVSLNASSIENSAAQLKSQLNLAKITYEKQKNLWDQNIGSEIQYIQAKSQVESLEAQLASMQSQVRMNEIRAPFSGYVNEIYLKEGELAGGLLPTLELVDLSQLKIEADVSEKYIAHIKKGQKVMVGFEALPNWQRGVTIKSISKVISMNSRTFQIELQFPNKNDLIKPNMVSKITITDFEDDQAFVIPSLIIKEDIKGKYVLLAAKNIAQKRYVQTGFSVNNQTMITSGLNLGDLVIVDGFNLISSGSEVKINN